MMLEDAPGTACFESRPKPVTVAFFACTSLHQFAVLSLHHTDVFILPNVTLSLHAYIVSHAMLAWLVPTSNEQECSPPFRAK